MTTTTTDPLGHATGVVTPDGAAITTEYDGAEVRVTDQARKRRSSLSDALGRLLKVVEAPGVAGYGFETAYEYDALDNLKEVTQGKAGQTRQTRTFLYDSLSRLVSATNPEACAQQPGRACAPTPLTYEYDPLNRIEMARETQGAAGGAENWKQKFTYDHFGKRRVDGNPDDPATSQSSSGFPNGF